MKKIVISALAILVISSQAYAHSDRTDKNGGHKCSQKSIDKGLCTGYHYHSGKAYSNNAEGHKKHQATHVHELSSDKKQVVQAKK
jgi:hypothetical protein